MRARQILLISSIALALVLFSVSPCSGVSYDLKLRFRFSALLLPILCFVALRRRGVQALGRIKANISFEEILLPLTVIALMLGWIENIQLDKEGSKLFIVMWGL